MSLKRKILVGYSLVCGLVIVVTLWAVVNLYRLGNASDAILQENYRSILAAENMLTALQRQDSALLLLMLGFGAEARQQFQANEVDFLQWLSRAKDNITLPDEAQTLTSLEAGYLEYLAASTRLFETSSAAAGQPSDYYHNTIWPGFRQVQDTAVQLREMNQQAMRLAADQAQRVALQAIVSTLIFGLAAAGLGLGLSLLLANILTHPLKEMARAAGRIAEGDYDVAITVTSQDEVGQLAREIMTMSGTLKAFHQLNVNRLLAEQQRSEAIIRNLTDGLVVVDHHYRIVALNPMAVQMLNLTRVQVVGSHFFEAIPNQTLYHHLKTTLETGQPPHLDETAATLTVALNDDTLYYHFAITPVKTEAGHLLGAVLLLQDVTKLKTLERLKSEFVMTASHELRTPLTSLAMSIGLLAENTQGALSDDNQALLSAAQEETQRLRALVNDLLDLSKIESGRMELDFEPVAVALLAERAVSILLPQARDKQVALNQQVPVDLPPVKADANKITWVLTNLIANATRYTEPGGHIETSAQLAGDLVHVSVTDDGAGIPLEDQSKIFDKFVQVKNGPASGGSGLGLAICREIIRAHGGAIWVNSTPGQGSTFTFTLPATSQKGAASDA